jgi:hypothetical protein
VSRSLFRDVIQHGTIATYGGYIRLPDIDSDAMLAFFRAVLEDIRIGGFGARFATPFRASRAPVATAPKGSVDRGWGGPAADRSGDASRS